MSSKMQTLVASLLAAPVLLGGFVSTVSAVQGRQLDTNNSTSTPSYIGGVTDQSGADYVTTNMFIGNWFGWQVAMTDAYAAHPSQYRLSIAVKCSDNQYYNSPLTTYYSIQSGAEAIAYCGLGTTPLASAHWIYYQ